MHYKINLGTCDLTVTVLTPKDTGRESESISVTLDSWDGDTIQDIAYICAASAKDEVEVFVYGDNSKENHTDKFTVAKLEKEELPGNGLFKYSLETITKTEYNRFRENGTSTKIGCFAAAEVFAVGDASIEGSIDTITIIAVEDWNVRGIKETGLPVMRFSHSDNVVLLVMNLNEIEAIEDERKKSGDEGAEMLVSVMNSFIERKTGFRNITRHVGYSTRSAFLYTGNGIGRRIYAELEKEAAVHV